VLVLTFPKGSSCTQDDSYISIGSQNWGGMGGLKNWPGEGEYFRGGGNPKIGVGHALVGGRGGGGCIGRSNTPLAGGGEINFRGGGHPQIGGGGGV
jgi:hypothetical protein